MTVTVSPSPSVTISASGSTSLCVGVFEWADTHLEREWMPEHGDVSVARDSGSPISGVDRCDVRGAEWLERGDVRVHVDGHMRQLRCRRRVQFP